MQAFDSLQSDAVHTCKLTRHIVTGLATRVARGYNNHMKYNIYIYNILHRGEMIWMTLKDLEIFYLSLSACFGRYPSCLRFPVLQVRVLPDFRARVAAPLVLAASFLLPRPRWILLAARALNFCFGIFFIRIVDVWPPPVVVAARLVMLHLLWIMHTCCTGRSRLGGGGLATGCLARHACRSWKMEEMEILK